MNTSQAPEPSLASQVAHIAGVLGSHGFPTGERASLRRLSPGHPSVAFYRFALRHLPGDWELHLHDWITLVAGMALMSPTAHRPDRGLGKALADAGYSEARLERLLAAEGSTRRALLLRTVRFLGAKATPFNWSDAAQLLLVQDEDKRERLHRRIARDFYRKNTDRER